MSGYLHYPVSTYLKLLDDCLAKIEGRVGEKFEKLADSINEISPDYQVKASSLQRNMYSKCKNMVAVGKEEEIKGYSSVTLNGLSMYAYGQKFEDKFRPSENGKEERKNTHKPLSSQQTEFEIQEFNDGRLVGSILRSLGIVEVTTELTRSKFEPAEVIKEAKRRLSVLGINGGKWVRQEDDFRRFLTKINARQGTAKFLLVNPKGTVFKNLKGYDGEPIRDDSSPVFKEFLEEYGCLEVRFYDFKPTFRMMFIDDGVLGLSSYFLDGDGDSGQFQVNEGWKIPHLSIKPEGDYTLYYKFGELFKYFWDNARPFDEVFNDDK